MALMYSKPSETLSLDDFVSSKPSSQLSYYYLSLLELSTILNILYIM